MFKAGDIITYEGREPESDRLEPLIVNRLEDNKVWLKCGSWLWTSQCIPVKPITNRKGFAGWIKEIEDAT